MIARRCRSNRCLPPDPQQAQDRRNPASGRRRGRRSRAPRAEHLRELGYQVLEAEDGLSALRVQDGLARLDLLVTDVGLPNGMNGRQLAETCAPAPAGAAGVVHHGVFRNDAGAGQRGGAQTVRSRHARAAGAVDRGRSWLQALSAVVCSGLLICGWCVRLRCRRACRRSCQDNSI